MRQANKYEKMKYFKERIKPIVLAEGIAYGHKYIILNLGTHPCSYIQIPKTSRLAKLGYDDININVHGGLTFGVGELTSTKIKGLWLGWDYAHAGDYAGDYKGNPILEKERKWTTEELIKEAEKACYELKELRKFINKILRKGTEVFLNE